MGISLQKQAPGGKILKFWSAEAYFQVGIIFPSTLILSIKISIINFFTLRVCLELNNLKVNICV